MRKRELEKLKKEMLKERERLIVDIRHIEKVTLKNSPKDANGDLSGYSIHLADYGTDTQETEKSLNLRAHEEARLNEIEEALQNMETGQYGTCLECNSDINVERLFAKPTAKLCLKCRKAYEVGKV